MNKFNIKSINKNPKKVGLKKMLNKRTFYQEKMMK